MIKLPLTKAAVFARNCPVAAPTSGIDITWVCPTDAAFVTVVLKAPPALVAAKIKVPLAAVAGNEINVPASPDEPEVIFPAVEVIAPEAVNAPVIDRACPRVTVVVAALIFPEVSENTGKALAVDAPPEKLTPPADGSALNTIASTPIALGNGSTSV